MSRCTVLAGSAWSLAALCNPCAADEGGVSFWLPGQLGSLVAVHADPGWSLPVSLYHSSADAGASKTFPLGGTIAAGLDASADLLFFIPTYTFARPMMGGQLALSAAWAYGEIGVDAQATLTAPLGSTLRVDPRDSHTGGSDLYPLATLRWNKGTSNYLLYAMGGIPVGDYEVGRLANTGINHYAIDAGGGYTYLDPQTGWEYSSAMGVTYNFENEDTDYRNGVDAHLDLGVSRFLSQTFMLGGVGYAYYQLTGDSGSGARLGDFKSRVFAIGPQATWFLGMHRVVLQLKGYYEFEAENRPEGWNGWISVVVPLGSHGKQ